MLRVVNSLVSGVFIVFLISGGLVKADATIQATPIFNEIKARYDSNNPLDYDEYIEIVNPYTEPINLAHYAIEYFNVTNPTDATLPPEPKSFADGLLAPGSSLVLAKRSAQITHSLQLPFSSLADGGGRLRLVTVEGDVVDEIAWGNSAVAATAPGVNPAVVHQCNSSTALCNANRLQSISRQLNAEGGYVLASPLWLLGTVSPVSSELIPIVVEEIEVPGNEVGSTSSRETTPTCEGIIITEILPNPSGSDTGKEFIELYNPTTRDIDLDGCSLQISSSSKKFALAGITMQPKSFLAITNSQSGLSLPNAAGGTVWLLTPTEEIQSIAYPAGMDDDAGWALVDGLWQISYVPTPAQPNIAMSLKPCSSGQQRDAETNRCESIVKTAVASLTPCKAGQVRNPDTNRCRTVVTAASLLVPCKPGQERNPETNRCRNIASTNELGSCPEGQERNPDTNRCRKVTGSGATLAAVTDVETAQQASGGAKWWLAGAAMLAAVGYGIFEWRQDIKNYLHKITRSLPDRTKHT